MVRLTLNHNVYREGDMATVSVFVGQNSYLYLIDQNPADQTFSLIVPNPQFLPVWYAKAGETVTFPSQENLHRGIVLQAQLPLHSSESHEILRVFASTKPLPPNLFISGIKNSDDLFARLYQEGVPFNDSEAIFTILGGDQQDKKHKTFMINSSTSHD